MTDTFIATVWFFMLKDSGFMFCAKFEGRMRTLCELTVWTVVMLASLPHTVNFFSKSSDEYYNVVAFLHWNTLQAVQSVQYTCRQNKHPSQSINVTFDGSCNRKKQNLLFLFSLYTDCIFFFFFTNKIIFGLKIGK